jgi:hypothetical protein
VVLNDELRGDWGAEAQGERRRLIQLVIRECANRSGRLTAIPAQEFDRGSFAHLGIFLGMFSV